MRIVEVTKDFSRNGFDFKAGHGYCMAEDVESQFRSVSGENLGMSHPFESKNVRPYKGEDLTNQRLMCFRTGGLGDLCFLLAALRYIKKKYPTCFIRVATGCPEPLQNVPEIDELHNMPFDANLLDDVNYVNFFQGIIEAGSDKSKSTHAVDMFFSYFNIDSTHLPIEDKKPKYFFKEDELKWLGEECTKLGITEKDFVVGIQMESSAPLRNYPKEKLKVVVDILAKEEDVKILLIGSGQQGPLAGYLKGSYPNVIAATGYTVRQSIILANRYNLVISQDSFMVQIAGGMDKPLIGLYGPFASEVRMKYFKNAVGLEPKVVCSPCYKHDFRACIKGYPSPCFSLINPEDILEAADYLRHKNYGSHFGYAGGFLRVPDFSEVEKYFLSADKGLCFFGGYFKHPNMITVDANKFAGADIYDLNAPFDRAAYPFVVFMHDFGFQNGSVYSNSKEFVRPGGYFVAVKQDCNEQFFLELKRDLGKSFVVLYSKFDIASRTGIIAGRKSF